MKERPILFSNAMVRALLAGKKTQTRRVVKCSDEIKDIADTKNWAQRLAGNACYGRPITDEDVEFKAKQLVGKLFPCINDDGRMFGITCPYGKPGDRLWVRETWGVVSNAWDESGSMIDWTPDRPVTTIHEMPFGNGYYSGHVIYAADGPFEWAGDDDGGGEPRSMWKPSIHLPRRASRILLEVVAVRVERLTDISDSGAKNDCTAEGVFQSGMTVPTYEEWDKDGFRSSEKWMYRNLWESINGVGSWAKNPWVWVVEFKKVPA